MSGWRPLIKGFLLALQSSWVQSCLRPVDAGLDAPVCIENLNPDVVMVKSAEDGV